MLKKKDGKRVIALVEERIFAAHDLSSLPPLSAHFMTTIQWLAVTILDIGKKK